MPADFRVIEGEYLKDILDQPRALKETFDALDISNPLSDLARRVREGAFQRIVLTGMGSSFHVLHPLSLQLIDHGLTAIMVETSELIHYQRQFLDPSTLIIAVSQSGRTVEMARLIEVNDKRSPVIAVMNTPESPLVEHATAAVLTRAGREFSVSSKTYVSAVMALIWLGEILCQREPKQTRSELEDAAPNVASYLAEWQEHVVALAALLKGIRHLFLVGRGASLAAAGTGALIVKESDHLPAEGMSSAAFRHGPLEMLGEETLVIVFAGDDKTRDLNVRLLADIEQIGGRAELIGNAARRECFRLKEYRGSLRPILEILPIQMITLAFAALAGREPGRFQLATKTTTTE